MKAQSDEHPAKYSEEIKPILTKLLQKYGSKKVYDPMAGVGTIHDIVPEGCESFATEIEKEWAEKHPKTICENMFYAIALFGPNAFDAVVTSPPYANRMADKHNARDNSPRHTYKHRLGRALTPGSCAGMQWGEEYMQFILKAWRIVVKVMKDHDAYPDDETGSIFILNTSDHVRKGKFIRVVRFHKDVCEWLGLELIETIPVETRRQRNGQNGHLRAEYEYVHVFRKPKNRQGSLEDFPYTKEHYEDKEKVQIPLQKAKKAKGQV